MSEQNQFSKECKRYSVSHVVNRDYPVAWVDEHLGVSTKKIYKWKAQFSKQVYSREHRDELATEIRRSKRELARLT